MVLNAEKGQLSLKLEKYYLFFLNAVANAFPMTLLVIEDECCFLVLLTERSLMNFRLSVFGAAGSSNRIDKAIRFRGMWNGNTFSNEKIKG